MRRRGLLLLPLVAALGFGACRGDDSESVSPVASHALGGTTSSADADRVTSPEITTAPTTPAATTAASTPAAPATTAPTTAAPTTTAAPVTTAAPTVPISPEAEALCGVLEAEPFVVRRDALAAATAGAAPASREQLETRCGAALTQLERANTVAGAAQALYDQFGLTADVHVTFPECTDTTAIVSVFNPSDVPIAVWGGVWGTSPDVPLGGLGARPFHIARIEPQSSGSAAVDTDPGAWAGGCAAGARFYVVPEGDLTADASIPGHAADDARVVDDPAVFLPELFRVSREAHLAEDLQILLGSEDLHSLDVPAVLAQWADQPAGDRPPPNLVVCGPVLEPAPGTMLATYRREATAVSLDGRSYGPRSLLDLGAYRKGADGAWRWLGRVVTLSADAPGSPC